MEVKVTTILKYPLQDVWSTMRDNLPLIAGYLDDVSSIEPIERSEQEDGVIVVVSRWHASPQLPAAVTQFARPEMFYWIDRAAWNETSATCSWAINSEFFGEHVACEGSTVFQPAMGGRGTRITFAGRMTLNSMPAGFERLEGFLTKGVESMVTRLVGSNFQKLAKATAQFIETGTQVHSEES